MKVFQNKTFLQLNDSSNQTVFIINSKAELLILPQIKRCLTFLKRYVYNISAKRLFITELLINCKMR